MMTFNQFGLKDELIQAVHSIGFTNPTPIQEKTIPLLISTTTDIIALAQTGTGKTAAFGLPLIHNIDPQSKNTQALVLSPTRELCMQIKDELVKYSQNLNINIVSVFGGASITNQITQLKRGAQIIVATPGRLMDMIDRKVINLKHTTTVVLDEADEMLNMGFKDDIDQILEFTEAREQAWLFSATMNNDVRKIAKKFMNNPTEIAVAKENVGNENIEHKYYVVNNKHRYEALQRLLDIVPDIYGIIFTRTKQDAHDISESLVKDGYSVSAIHGDLDQKMRSKVMDRFKKKQLQVLVATDVAARGIDVNDITHVINYELPDDPEVYTHRSGRTARAGKKGVCISIISSREIAKIRRIEKIVNSKFSREDVPSGNEVITAKCNNLIHQISLLEPEEEFLDFYNNNLKEILSQYTDEDIIQRLLWLNLRGVFDAHANADDLNLSIKENNRSESTSSKGDTRIFINLGKKDGLNPKKLADYIADSLDIEYKSIDRITVTDLSSYFNVPNQYVDFIIENIAAQKYNGRKIRVDIAEERGSSRRGDRKRFGDKRSGNDRFDSYDKKKSFSTSFDKKRGGDYRKDKSDKKHYAKKMM